MENTTDGSPRELIFKTKKNKNSVAKNISEGIAIVSDNTVPIDIKKEKLSTEDWFMQFLPLFSGDLNVLKTLLSLTYENNNPIINQNNEDIVKEVISLYMKNGLDFTVQFLNGCKNNEHIFWESPEMSEARESLAHEASVYQTQEQGVKGVGKCKYCPSTELAYATKQTRSGDEPQTIFVQCTMCRKKWRE